MNTRWREIQLRKLGLEPSDYSQIGLFSLNTSYNLGEYKVDTYSESDILLKYFFHSRFGMFELSSEVFSIERRIGAKVIPRSILWNTDTKWWKLCKAVFGSPYSVEHPREYTEKLMTTRVYLGEDPQPYIEALEKIGKMFE